MNKIKGVNRRLIQSLVSFNCLSYKKQIILQKSIWKLESQLRKWWMRSYKLYKIKFTKFWQKKMIPKKTFIKAKIWTKPWKILNHMINILPSTTVKTKERKRKWYSLPLEIRKVQRDLQLKVNFPIIHTLEVLANSQQKFQQLD